MNAKFESAVGHICVFTDDGITCKNHDTHRFYPYGSIDVIKTGLTGVVEISGGGKRFFFMPQGYDKSRFKEMIAYAQNAKRTAPSAVPVELEEASDMLKKDVQSIINFFGGMRDKQSQVAASGIPDMVNSMSDDENIIFAFKGTILQINRGRNSVVGYIAVMTNKKLYYAGCDGQAVMSYLKAGSIELKDVHAISMGAQTFTTPAYVKFETKNEDYKLSTFSDPSKIKAKLEEAVKAAKEASSVAPAPAVVQAALSPADELKKFKELLDMGIITQDEFNAKKKQLLGL